MVTRVASSERPRPLVPESIVDAPTQRLYAIGVFVALQAYKIYDLLKLETSSISDVPKSGFLVKWIIIDAIYLRLLPKFRIPWLSFQPAATLLQIAIFAAINLLLSSLSSLKWISIGSILLPYFKKKELSISEHKINPNNVIHNSSRILGQYTLQVLPEGTAKINPLHENYCLNSLRKDQYVDLAIQFNSTIPKYIQYSHVDLETKEETLVEVSGRSLRKLLSSSSKNPKEPRLQTIYLKTNKRGLYTLKHVVDKSKLDVRIFRSEAVVVSCPTATFASRQSGGRLRERCVGDTDNAELKVTGVAPLQVTYRNWDGKHFNTHIIDSTIPDDFHPPAVVLSSNPKDIVFYKGIDIQWARSSEIFVPINTLLKAPGQWIYAVTQVTDALGNSQQFPSNDQFLLRFAHGYTEADGESHSLPENVYSVFVHQRPDIQFRGCSIESPANLFPNKETSLSLYSSFSEYNSLEVGVDRYELGLDPQNITVPPLSHKTYQISPRSSANINVKKPGIYVLSSVSSQYCSGEVLEPNTCLVVTPPEAKVSVSFEEISDQCAGSIGARADLELEGTPPFTIAYRMTKDNEASRIQYVTTDRTRYQLNFTPKKAGKYRYIILGIQDANYGYRELSGSSFYKDQTVFPLADASFEERRNGDLSTVVKTSCIGDTMSLPVLLTGSAPWTLEYEIFRNNKREESHVVESKDPRYILEVPMLVHGSQYTITLVSVKDSNGCKRSLNTADTVIKVRRQRPTATFYSSDNTYTLKSVEGALMKIPLRLAGEKPWYVEYSHTSGLNKVSHHKEVLNDPNSYLTVRKSGTYTLLSVSDSSCPGTIQNVEQKYQVEWLPRPFLSIPSLESSVKGKTRYYEQNAVCAGDSSAFEVQLSGSGPFLLKHDKILVDEKSKTYPKQKSELSTVQNTVLVKADTAVPGVYHYEFTKLSDSLYSDSDAVTIVNNQSYQAVVLQRVNSLPKASFMNVEKLYTFCINTDVTQSNAQLIAIQLQGASPFSLVIGIKNELTGSVSKYTLNDIHESVYKFAFPQEQLTLGKHVVRLLQVRDANGCAASITKTQPAAKVSVVEMASLAPLGSRQYYCVGDRLSFALQGLPPFDVEYEFNGVTQHATSDSHILTRLIELPGVVAMKSISDHGSHCKSYINPPIEQIVHDIPTVRISNGKDVIENIHEGDQAEISFHFTGTPPFSFSYARRALGKKRPGKVLETHTVTGINEYEYKVLSSVEGVYTVLSVQDKYCRYPQDSTSSSNI
ncbi:nucleoporin, transmembrane ring glycoprotein subunit Pom152 [Schizosaccharomyces pombe]|uniref:Nucleoporin pom152 n=1 Tax=Schizosaccharomyces pombe (strain 972 / ATCC 24843) TaxID=284812 RepID=PO152_SCHPO|nr:nucleoporin Pom152 [Schizosaccharomyces pombe]O94385.3 RecName: Full=Nucleoporin pom152 [Schizosaccharomyces pombe 972h-]CAA22435.1 nucleoporin Pom152 [Schizosaccharomyces pombe]|eukprot:NP_596052.1 nucleoporin Pom152 [Schizosaccharomyces pombe]